MKKEYALIWPVDGVCDMCDYFLGRHCGFDGTKHREDGGDGKGPCGADTPRQPPVIKVKKWQKNSKDLRKRLTGSIKESANLRKELNGIQVSGRREVKSNQGH